MKSFENKVAAITGAGSGIGRALAYHLARQGCHLALSDVNVEGLRETAEQARKRQAFAACQRVPCRHIDAGLRQPLQAGEAEQGEALGQLALDLERQQLVAGDEL